MTIVIAYGAVSIGQEPHDKNLPVANRLSCGWEARTLQLTLTLPFAFLVQPRSFSLEHSIVDATVVSLQNIFDGGEGVERLKVTLSRVRCASTDPISQRRTFDPLR
jgi:hypothetical protein